MLVQQGVFSSEDVAFLRAGLQKGSQKKYDSAVLHWDRYQAEHAPNIPTELLGSMPPDAFRLVMVKFVRHLSEAVNLSSSSISGVLASIQYVLKTSGKSVHNFKDPMLSLARSATLPPQRARSETQLANQQTPVTVDMIVWLRGELWVGDKVDSMMTYMGCALGFTFLLRVSEFVQDRSCEEHAFLAKDITLYMTDKNTRHPWTLRPSEVTLVHSASLINHSNKAGHRKTLFIDRSSVLESELVSDIAQWCVVSKVKADDPFLSRWEIRNGKSFHKKLTRPMINAALKSAASAFNVSTLKMSTRGCRVGGASSMKAKGGEAARDVICETGGWSREAGRDLLYERDNPLAANALSITRTSSNILTTDDIRHMAAATQVGIKRRRTDVGDALSQP